MKSVYLGHFGFLTIGECQTYFDRFGESVVCDGDHHRVSTPMAEKPEKPEFKTKTSISDFLVKSGAIAYFLII